MIIIDDFIKDESLLEEIKNDSKFFETPGKYMWWGGWWNSPADTLKKRLIQYIWGENSPHEPLNCIGFEYWTGTYGEGGTNKQLDLHFDKDEYLWKSQEKLSTPLMGTVFYPLPMDIDGGYLEVQSKEGDLTERIQAKYNRLIIFPAGKYPHKVTEVTRGVRNAIAINLWDVEPQGLYNDDFIVQE